MQTIGLKNGYTAQVVEKFNHFAKVRQDLFGIIDVLAFHNESKEILGVQCTSLSNFSSRKTKVLGSDTLLPWLQAGGKFEVHGWFKKEGKWEVRRERLVA